MKTRCSLSPSIQPDDHVWQDVVAILARADASAGTAVISDQALFDARSGQRKLILIRANDSSQLAGIAVLGHSELDLVIDPPRRGEGIGTAALTQILAETTGSLSTWVHGHNPVADGVLSRAGFRAIRTLLKMTAPITSYTPDANNVKHAPTGYTLRAFRSEDSAAWLALNARVFAEHPEQGRLTESDLNARLDEPWFDPENFLLLFDDSVELIGYCWLKVEGGEGEIYVIGVSPEHAGQGLGATLLDAGVERLAQIAHAQGNITRVSLFVEADNERAIHLYRSKGFTEALSSRQWMFSRA